MADENEINYDALIKEVDGITPTTQDAEEQERTVARMVEMQKELSEVAYADRNDDYTLVWNGLQEKANAIIAELAGKSMDDISAEQLSAFKSLLENFTSHTSEEYNGIAAELKNKLDRREEILNAQVATEELHEEEASRPQEGNETSGSEPVTEEEDSREDKPVNEDDAREDIPVNEDDVREDMPITEEEKDDMSDTAGVEPDSKQTAFLESINEENKAQIVARYDRIDQAADELGDVFAEPQDENSEDLFKGLRNFYKNVWVDRDIPEDEDVQPSKKDIKKQQQLKERMQQMATIMAIQDMVQDGSIDSMSPEELRKRMKENVRDNMEFLTYNLLANQSSFEILKSMPDVTKMTPQQRQEHMAALLKNKDVFNGIDSILSGDSKATARSVSSPAIVATVIPQYKQSKQFAHDLKKRAGIKKLWKRVRDFDDKMTKDHPQLWGIAKSVSVSALTGPVGMMVYTGHSIYKQSKELRDDYKQQKAEKGEEALSVGKFLWQNKGKLASMAISTSFAAYGGISGLNFGDIAQSLANNTGILGNMTGSLLSGDALNNISQNLSWDNLKNAVGNMVDRIAGISHVDTSQVLDTIKQSYNPTRMLRVGLSSMGVGIAKAHDAYSTAEDGNKWKAARKAFAAHLTASLTGLAIADAMTATGDVVNQTSIELKDIETQEQEFMKGLNDIENGNIPVEGLGLGENTVHIGDPNSGVHIGTEAEKLNDIVIPKAPSAEAVHDYTPAQHEAPAPQQHEAPAPQQKETLTTETTPAHTETEQKFLEVNGEKIQVDYKDGMTTEDVMDKAREMYLKNHPEIPAENNKVEITQGDDFKSSIETQKENITKDGTVIGQETAIHRELPDQNDNTIKDDIKEVRTDAGQAKLMESEGRIDGDTKNNIPDEAKILSVNEIHTQDQDMKITRYEHEGKVYITDGENTRLAPTHGPQSAENLHETWKAHLKDVASGEYDGNATNTVQDTQQAQVPAGQTPVTPAEQSPVTPAGQDGKGGAVNTDSGVKTADGTPPTGNGTPPSTEQGHDTPPEVSKDVRTAGGDEAQSDTPPDNHLNMPSTTQSGLSYRFSENSNTISITNNPHWTGNNGDGVFSGRYVNHLLPEEYADKPTTEEILKARAEIQSIIVQHEIYNDLNAQSETRELTQVEKSFMKAHETLIEQKGLVSREDGVLEHKDTPKEQYFQLKLQPNEEVHESVSTAEQPVQNAVTTHEFVQKANGFAITENGETRMVVADNKGVLHFKINNDDGTTRLMTKSEAVQFLSDVKTQGSEAGNFDEKLYKNILTSNHLKESCIVYAPPGTEKPPVSDANVRSFTLRQLSGGKQK